MSRHHYNWDGTLKQGVHKTKAAAKAHIRDLERAGKIERRELRAYLCSVCGWYHIGHPRICLTCWQFFSPEFDDQQHCEECSTAPGDRR